MHRIEASINLKKKLLKSRGFFLLKAFLNIICGGVQECQHR